MKAMRGVSDEDLVRVCTFADYQVTPQWIIHLLMKHEAEHRGEIMVIKEVGNKLLHSD